VTRHVRIGRVSIAPTLVARSLIDRLLVAAILA
jgi:hypothetical protein